MSAKRGFKNNLGVFCFICGNFTLVKHQKDTSEFAKKAYLALFQIRLGDQEEPWILKRFVLFVILICVNRHWKKDPCCLSYPLFGGSRQIIQQIVTFVWPRPRGFIYINPNSDIQLFNLQSDQFTFWWPFCTCLYRISWW